MIKAGQRTGTILALAYGLLVLSACGKSALGLHADATVPPDVASDPLPVDNAPIAHDDVAAVSPDLAATADLTPDNIILPPDLPPLSDVPGDLKPTADNNLLDVADIASREVNASDPMRGEMTSPADIPADRRPTYDLVLNPDELVFDLSPAPDELPPKRDTYITLDEGPGLSSQCTASGGTATTQSCCSSAAYFRDTCTTAVGACGCSPSTSVTVDVCTCPNGGCFLPGAGCVGPASTCTVGMDQTCNDSPIISSIHGKCIPGGRCLCTTFALSATSGKCL